MMVTDKEKQIQATVSQYRYESYGTDTEDPRNNLSCCKDHERKIERYKNQLIYSIFGFLKFTETLERTEAGVFNPCRCLLLFTKILIELF